VNIFDDYVVLDVDCDGQARRRINSAECFRVRGGVRVADANCSNFYHPIEDSVPLDHFSQELTRFLQGLPVVCYRAHYIRELIEYELHFHGFDGFISYVGIEEIARAKNSNKIFSFGILWKSLIYAICIPTKFDRVKYLQPGYLTSTEFMKS